MSDMSSPHTLSVLFFFRAFLVFFVLIPKEFYNQFYAYDTVLNQECLSEALSEFFF